MIALFLDKWGTKIACLWNFIKQTVSVGESPSKADVGIPSPSVSNIPRNAYKTQDSINLAVIKAKGDIILKYHHVIEMNTNSSVQYSYRPPRLSSASFSVTLHSPLISLDNRQYSFEHCSTVLTSLPYTDKSTVCWNSLNFIPLQFIPRSLTFDYRHHSIFISLRAPTPFQFPILILSSSLYLNT